jgi:GntP family gluconate:H+ symporter
MNSLLSLLISLVLSVAVLALLLRFARLHAFFALLIASMLFGLLTHQTILSTLQAMQAGFGSLLQQIGLLVAFGSCLGMMLEKTGSMEVVSRKILQWAGIKRATGAMTLLGVLVGVPVFCDSGFIILSRLIPGIASQAGVPAAQLSLSLASGLYTTHVLVPPTPGPLAAAATFSLADNISSLIVISLIVTVPVAIVAHFFSKKLSGDITVSVIETETKKPVDRNVWQALLPLVLPILLIAAASLPKLFLWMKPVENILQVTGQPAIALFIGLLLSFLLLKKSDLREFPGWLSTALKDAGIILLITGAGGAFGAVIKMSGIDQHLKEALSGSEVQGILFLCAAFLLAAVVKTAQGSSTSAIIITSSLLAPLAALAGFHTAWQVSVLITAIGGGAMTVSHVNDSYFWVVSQFSGIAPAQALKSFTLLTLMQGLTVLISSILLFLML